jgi:hypothetical protein
MLTKPEIKVLLLRHRVRDPDVGQNLSDVSWTLRRNDPELSWLLHRKCAQWYEC